MAVLGRTPEEYGLRPRQWRNEIAVGGCIALAVILAPLLAEGVFGRIQLRRDDLGFIASVIMYKFFFVGFGEELLFRGLIQGELNRAFEKLFGFGSVRFGWGLVLTAAVFGFAHVLNPFNPVIGSFALDFGDLLPTAVIGLMLGFFREYYGSIVAASLIHGGWDLAMALSRLGTPGTIAMGVTLFSIWMYLGIRFTGSKSPT